MEFAMKTVIGCDYSMNAPAICAHVGEKWSFKNCKFFFRTEKKSLVCETKNIIGSLACDYTSQEHRFFLNAYWAENYIKEFTPNLICLEGYAMGSTGRVFSIGENTGRLKHVFWRNKWKFITPPPTVIKKFASTKGNANKEVMEASFMEEVGFDFRKAIGQSATTFNPSSDLVDSYFMAKYGFDQLSLGESSTYDAVRNQSVTK
jgi:hypothetical protein